MQFTNLGPRVTVVEVPMWATNVAIVRSEQASLICDPCFTVAEIQAQRDFAFPNGARDDVSIVLTHADVDHICGLGMFPDATVFGSQDSKARLDEGSVLDDLDDWRTEWAEDWSEGIRIDRVIAPGDAIACGDIVAIALPGRHHGRDGLTYVLPDDGILLAGDFLADVAYPIVLGSISEMAATLRAIVEAIDEHSIQHVVPAHGGVLSASAARTIAAQDLAYIQTLRAAAIQAIEAGLPAGRSLLAVFEVEPPRPARSDFEMYDTRTSNAREALLDVQRANRTQ